MRFAPLVTAVLLVVPVAAYAHPKLVSATPAANSAVGAPGKIELVFSEDLIAKLSGITVVMTSMPGAKMNNPMNIPGAIALGADGKTLTLTLAKPLAKGSYKVTYKVVSTDTHRVDGNYQFQVK
jgi:methionine-rich copper-binding protein CopC